MPAPRLSQSAEAARAAALQAEFNEKKWVWVPDEKDGYLAGWVNKEDDDMGEIVMAAGGEIRRVPLYALSKMNPPKFDRVDDIADLTFLNEASVVHNLRLRYGSGAIYTYSGLFLVAINPYQPLPLYSSAIIQQYRNKRRDENPPHIFAVAERAWINMGEERENQSILITGESGAGKTESTKKVIQYLAAIASDAHPPPSSPSPSISSALSFSSRNTHSHSHAHSHSPSSSTILKPKDRLNLLERQILQANPVLEAFGNAQTQRNNNSSRFGKFVRIAFAPGGSIAGATVDWYLLEKSRVVVRHEAERSFHVFYQLLAGDREVKDKLLLEGGVEDYEYLNKSRREIDGVNDREEWLALKSALDIVGFTPAEQLDLFRIVAAILHIGNVQINATRADDAVLADPAQAERVCHLLGVPVSEFTRAVLRPRVLAGREWVTQARTQRQALDELSALCKMLYERAFGQLVERINRALDRPASKSTFIGVLDIAGFEIFETNAYEQLLINYTNEKLQQFFNTHMFVLEQEEYAREGISWDFVNFGLDLQPTIELIEGTPGAIGILSCLDEECIMPKATDTTFTAKLHQMWAGDQPEDVEPHPGRAKYEPARFEQGFLVQHYAGKVEYRTDGWLEKNKDPLNDNLSRVLGASTEHYVAGLFSDYADSPALHSTLNVSNLRSASSTLGKKRFIKKGAFRTVGQRHKEQLSSLMAQLQSTQPHFVRCIVPNTYKKPGRVDVPLVLDQLRCNGVLEGIRIARLGYPNRLPFAEFRQRYEALVPGVIPRGYMDGRKACLRMVDALELDKAVYRVGTSKIFFKAGVLAELEERRDALLFDIFSRLQAVCRMWSARRQIKKILNRAVAIRTIQKNARVYGELRDWPWWQLYTKIRPLLAATRNDEELRKKDTELALIKERAERDKQEREALERLKMSLEADKRKVEEALEAERTLTLDKDSLLERSKKREVELQEELAAMQADLDLLDSQLDRALKIQREGRIDRDELAKLGEEFKNLVSQREEDLARAKERADAIVVELESKLTIEMNSRDLLKSKSESLEKELRQAKDQVGELSRTATEYSSLIAKKEADAARVEGEVSALKQERNKLSKQILELQGRITTLTAELNTQKEDQIRSEQSTAKLQEELDELRSMMAAKSSEEERRNEVEKSKEVELADLRAQASKLQHELSEARRVGLEAQSKLKLQLDTSVREQSALQRAYDSLLERERTCREQLTKVESSLPELEKTKRSLESELQSVHTRQIDAESQLAEALKAKETLERHLAAAQSKYQDFEDAVLQLEREKDASARHVDKMRKDLEAEASKRSQLEKLVSNQKSEIASLRDRLVKFDRDLNKTLNDLKAREWEVKQLESRQDKTIVEHVHVLEEAKKVTDRQLAEAQAELQKNAAYIRSLEKSKSRLMGEAEDLVRETERERVELRAKEKAVKTQEERIAKASADAENERRGREAAEQLVRKLQKEMLGSHNKIAEVSEQLSFVHRSKDNLEMELARLADETPSSNSMAKVQRDYEARIAQLEEQVHAAESAMSMTSRLKDQIERQHSEIRRLIMSDGPKDEAFRSRLLRELQLADQELEAEMSSRVRSRDGRGADARTMGNVTPSKQLSHNANGTPRSRRGSHPDPPKASDKQVTALQQHVQVLELRLAASDRVRRHLETTLGEITSELENSDGSKQFLQQYRTRLAKENTRLAELLEDEAQARRAAEAAHMDGIQAMWDKFQNTITEERANYARLEESKKAMLIQQRSAQVELEDSRNQIRELSQAKKQLQSENGDLKEQLDAERAAKNEESTAKRKLQTRLQEQELSSSSSSAAQSELREAVETFKGKAETYMARFEAAEIARAKATRAESFVRKSLTELEKLHATMSAEKKDGEERLQAAKRKIQELQTKLENEGRESSDLDLLRQQLTEELEDERKQHVKDLQERDFTIDQTRKKYQTELAQLSEELQSQRDALSRLREDNRTLRSDYDNLQMRHDDEVFNGGAWKKEKERMETKISDVTKAYEAAVAAQAEQQSQIVALHSQVRELRGVLNDAETDRALLQKARRALQAELETIKLDNVDSSKISSDRELQKLQLEKQDLARSVEEYEDRITLSLDRMKKAEAHAAECQVELGKIRVENSELDKLNAHLENQIKELNVRIVDLETKAYASGPRPSIGSRRPDNRIEDLTNQLAQSVKERNDSSKLARDAKFQLAESDRQRARLEEERKQYEAQIQSLREALDLVQTEESDLQLAKRRSEREAVDLKQRALNLQRENERLRSLLDRPAPGLASPAGSPRKHHS